MGKQSDIRRWAGMVLLMTSALLPVGSGTLYAQASCKVCERLHLFDVLKAEVGKHYWPTLATHRPSPLIYFDDSSSYVVFASASLYSKEDKAHVISCPSGIKLERIPRLGKVPFYMQNKTDYNDTSSPYYFNPTMFCSDPEALRRVVPEFTTTEHWLQLLIHEYFHAFQLSHDSLLSYFDSRIKLTEDSLDRLYLSDSALAAALRAENSSLLAALHAKANDTVAFYARRFLQQREVRRARYFKGTNLATVEDFWEKMEGPARYVEYYMGLSFPKMKHSISCDTMFRSFAAFRGKGRLEDTEVFVERTKMSPAYYYASGFNLCRLLDKLNVNYKAQLFDQPALSLMELLRLRLAD